LFEGELGSACSANNFEEFVDVGEAFEGAGQEVDVFAAVEQEGEFTSSHRSHALRGNAAETLCVQSSRDHHATQSVWGLRCPRGAWERCMYRGAALWEAIVLGDFVVSLVVCHFDMATTSLNPHLPTTKFTRFAH
jgi:hypothetical protein